MASNLQQCILKQNLIVPNGKRYILQHLENPPSCLGGGYRLLDIYYSAKLTAQQMLPVSIACCPHLAVVGTR